MMKVEILRGVVLDNGETSKPGDKVEVGDKFSSYLIRAGKAKVVPVPKKRAKKEEG